MSSSFQSAAAVPSSFSKVSVDGFVVPTWLNKVAHLAAVLGGSALLVVPQIWPHVRIPSNLGTLAQALAGGSLSLGGLASYVSVDKHHTDINTAILQSRSRVSAASAAPVAQAAPSSSAEMETLMTSTVLPAIREMHTKGFI